MPKETTNVRIPRALFEEAREATSVMEQRLGFRPSVSQFVEKSIRDSIRRLQAGDLGFLDSLDPDKKDSKPPRK
ncbi:MAG: hypothetical protein CMN76_02025 [Spirochaetaceae bacterium]|nr:hypothetical protein [Spirochaetaceae bacterium]|tara:strand:- start:1938 stop:2159 length:222 start_codon:yes stop_codon:yes gene_type:complete